MSRLVPREPPPPPVVSAARDQALEGFQGWASLACGDAGLGRGLTESLAAYGGASVEDRAECLARLADFAAAAAAMPGQGGREPSLGDRVAAFAGMVCTDTHLAEFRRAERTHSVLVDFLREWGRDNVEAVARALGAAVVRSGDRVYAIRRGRPLAMFEGPPASLQGDADVVHGGTWVDVPDPSDPHGRRRHRLPVGASIRVDVYDAASARFVPMDILIQDFSG